MSATALRIVEGSSMDKTKALSAALSQIERQFGKGSVMKMNDHAAVSVGAVSTGSLALDLALGIGGLPRGRVVEVFGPESSGKTTLVYHVIAEAQRRGIGRGSAPARRAPSAARADSARLTRAGRSRRPRRCAASQPCEVTAPRVSARDILRSADTAS